MAMLADSAKSPRLGCVGLNASCELHAWLQDLAEALLQIMQVLRPQHERVLARAVEEPAAPEGVH